MPASSIFGQVSLISKATRSGNGKKNGRKNFTSEEEWSDSMNRSAWSHSMTTINTRSPTMVGNNSSNGSVVTAVATPSAPDAKLKRMLEQNRRLKEQLELQCIPVSEASRSLINFVMSTKDPSLPKLWGIPPIDPFARKPIGHCSPS